MAGLVFASSMSHKEDGFTLIESLVVLVVIGIMFFFLVDALNPTALQNKAKNASLRSALIRIALSADSFVISYQRVPNETEFLEALSSNSIEFEDSCSIFGLPNYECLFKPGSRQLPATCDLSNWRLNQNAKSKTNDCYVRYVASNALGTNQTDGSNYRLYVKMFGKENAFYIYDSSASGELYKCPGTLTDFDELEECYAI